MTRPPRSDPTIALFNGAESAAHSLLREMRKQVVLPLWSGVCVAAGQQLIDHGLAIAVAINCRDYATSPKLAIQITDEGRKVRLRRRRA